MDPLDSHEHTVALVAEVLAAQPLGTVVLVGVSVGAESASAPLATSPRSCSVRSENQVSKLTPMRPRSSRSPATHLSRSPTPAPGRS